LRPDYVLTVADRYETMATAIAATYSSIPLIHLQGGEVSGNIDDRVRHSITKLADIHFACSEQSKERIIKMGEDEKVVFNFGCPAMDVAKEADKRLTNEYMAKYQGTGEGIDWNKPYILLNQHPVTTSFGDGFRQISESLKALLNFPNYQKIILWPNIDAGSDDVAKGIRVFRETGKDKGNKFHYFRNFSPEDYVKIIANSSCCVGNSSSFIREGSFLGTPVVLVGDRQYGREMGKNCVISDYDAASISALLQKQLEHGRYESDNIFGHGDAGEKIAACLAKIEIPAIKRITY
jgi:UDP-hydrolysing UDP-N-acetyl-D-glucosamine 2-epimerase